MARLKSERLDVTEKDREEREKREEMGGGQVKEEIVGKRSCFGCERKAAPTSTNCGGRRRVKNDKIRVNLNANLFKMRCNLDKAML